MTRPETPFVLHGELIIVETFVAGPRGRLPARFVLDTGATFTTMIPELADLIGYSARDGIKRTRVHTAVGAEEGYVLQVAELAVLGHAMTSFLVHVFDLGHDDIDGLLGMNFLCQLNFEIRPAEQRIFAEKIMP